MVSKCTQTQDSFTSKIAAGLGVMMTEKDGTHTTKMEKKNSNTVEKETLQCDKIKSKRD